MKVEDYLSEIRTATEGIEEGVKQIAELIFSADRMGRRVWILGNGGSLAVAQHFAQDILKMCGLKAQTINCPSTITAYANDDGFGMAYYKPLFVLADPDDLVIIFSCSGKSRNYIEFVSSLGQRFKIVSVTGTDGGFLAELSAVSVRVRSSDYQVCETAFCVISDLILRELKGALA